MRSLFLLAFGGVAAAASAPLEKIIFVEPPLRFITQCELREWNDRELTCVREGWPKRVALAPGVTVWKGKDRPDTSSLRAGDRLDIKLGIDSQSREVATFIWANFVKVEGVVGVRDTLHWIRIHPLASEAAGEVAAQPIWVRMDGDTSFVGGKRVDELKQGRPVIVIGERLDERRLRASRVVMSRD
jgi:hypothetical protein